MKQNILGILGIIGAAFASMLGGWDAGLVTLLIFMGIDYITGVMIAALFKKSKKSKSGGLNSLVGWQGLARKCMTLLFVLIAHRLDLLVGTTYIRDAVVIAFCANELISIVENAGIMGLPVPAAIVNVIDILNRKETETNDVH